MAAMLSKWAPPLERSKMTTFIYAGNEYRIAARYSYLLLFIYFILVFLLDFLRTCVVLYSINIQILIAFSGMDED